MRLLFFIGVLAALARPASAAPADPVASLKAEVTKLQERILELETNVFDHTFKLQELEQGTASLTLGNPGYDTARNEHGQFPIFYERADAFADGQELRFKLGNMANATFVGAEITLNYGAPREAAADGTSSAAQWRAYLAGRHEMKATVTTEFRPGTYTVFIVRVVPATAAEIREVKVGITFDNLRMVNQ